MKRQKHKHMKRPRSWHHRGNGPDRANRRAQEMIDRALRGKSVDERTG